MRCVLFSSSFQGFFFFRCALSQYFFSLLVLTALVLTSRFFLILTLRSCNGHAPLIIQEGRACAGQIVQPRRVGHPHTRQFLSTRMGEGGSDCEKCLMFFLLLPASLPPLRSCNGEYSGKCIFCPMRCVLFSSSFRAG
jgi:hypothetical protein